MLRLSILRRGGWCRTWLVRPVETQSPLPPLLPHHNCFSSLPSTSSHSHSPNGKMAKDKNSDGMLSCSLHFRKDSHSVRRRFSATSSDDTLVPASGPKPPSETSETTGESSSSDSSSDSESDDSDSDGKNRVEVDGAGKSTPDADVDAQATTTQGEEGDLKESVSTPAKKPSSWTDAIEVEEDTPSPASFMALEFRQSIQREGEGKAQRTTPLIQEDKDMGDTQVDAKGIKRQQGDQGETSGEVETREEILVQVTDTEEIQHETPQLTQTADDEDREITDQGATGMSVDDDVHKPTVDLLKEMLATQKMKQETQSPPEETHLRTESPTEMEATEETIPLMEEQQGEGGEEDVLYQQIDIEVRGHDRAVLDSYQTYFTTAADHLGVCVAEVSTPRAVFNRWVVLKSVHIHKDHRVQYETRTNFRLFRLENITGSTADTFLEYTQRNLPEGVAMKVTRHRIERIPPHIHSPHPHTWELTEEEHTTQTLTDKEHTHAN